MNGNKERLLPVSVIISVYNMDEWLDQCLETVVGQTFREFEVLLLNDGSTDGSDAKCRKWAQRDSRIKYIATGNYGLSLTRNAGLMAANGRYVVFIDGDDWIDRRYLEKLYHAGAAADADMVECDIWQYDMRTGEKIYHCCYGTMGQEYTLEEHMQYGNTRIWKCMLRREMLLKHRIEFSECINPADAVYALLLALSNRVVNVREPLYYYRRCREDSLSQKVRKESSDMTRQIETFGYLLAGFKRCSIYRQYEPLLERIVKYKLSVFLAGFFHWKDRHDFYQMITGCYQFIRDQFPEARNETYITLGGCNLNRIMRHVTLLHNPKCSFNFSSIIAIMNPMREKRMLVHKHTYCEIMLNRETGNLFFRFVNELKPRYLFLDFLEERFDIVECNSGYLTKSDALDECETELAVERVILRDSAEGMELWERSCLDFIMAFRIGHPEITIVLVKNYLSDSYGDIHGQEMYEEIEQIRRVNDILKQYYDFFEMNCREAVVVEAADCQYYFTDEQSAGGALPLQLNEIVNREIAKRIEMEVFSTFS